MDDEFSYDDFDDDIPQRPRGIRFGEGQDANRAGRPAGAKNRKKIVEKVCRKRFTVKRGGASRRMTLLEIVLTAVQTCSAKGNIRAFRLKERLVSNFAPQEHQPRGVLILGEETTPEQWMARKAEGLTHEQFAARIDAGGRPLQGPLDPTDQASLP